MRLCAFVLSALLLGSLPRIARAATADDQAARAHYLAGQSYYEMADYADALREFNESYRLSKRAALLYNVALCEERLGRPADAAASLERYLAEDPRVPDKESIEARIANLKQSASGQPVVAPPPQPSPAPVTRTPTPPSPVAAAPAPEKPRRIYTWIVGGVGVALLASGMATGIVSQLRYNDLSSKCPGNLCPPGSQNEISTGKTLALATDVLLPLGVAAVATSVVLYFFEGRHPKKSNLAHALLVPTLAPGGGGVALTADY